MTFHSLKGQVLALGLGSIAGYGAFRIGMPLPWMLGPMIVNTLASMFRVPVHAPIRLRPFVIPIIGVMLGASVTSEILAQLPQWAVTLAVLCPFLAVAAFVSFRVYRQIGGYDPVTAYYAAMPGGLNEMILLGTANGGDEKKIALAHASRVLVTIAMVGLFYGLFLHVRSGGGGRTWIALDGLTILDWLTLAGCAAIGAPLGQRLRLPAANLLGPMILSAAAHVSHIVAVAPPSLLVIIAQIVLGSVIGCRFVNVPAKEIGRDLLLGILSCSGMLLAAVAFSLLTSELTGTPISAVFLAYSPGGLTEMSLLALAMGADAAYVSVMHILRILMIIVAAPIVFKRTKSGRA